MTIQCLPSRPLLSGFLGESFSFFYIKTDFHLISFLFQRFRHPDNSRESFDSDQPSKLLSADEEEADTDLETDRLLGQQRLDDQGFFDDKVRVMITLHLILCHTHILGNLVHFHFYCFVLCVFLSRKNHPRTFSHLSYLEQLVRSYK